MPQVGHPCHCKDVRAEYQTTKLKGRKEDCYFAWSVIFPPFAQLVSSHSLGVSSNAIFSNRPFLTMESEVGPPDYYF